MLQSPYLGDRTLAYSFM